MPRVARSGHLREVTLRRPTRGGVLVTLVRFAKAGVMTRPHRSRPYDSRVSITWVRFRLLMLATAAGFLAIALTIRAGAAGALDSTGRLEQ